MIAVAKSNGNCCKQTEHRKYFVTTNLVSIFSSPGKKVKKHELDDIKSIIGCSCSTGKRTRHRFSAKQAHLMLVPTDKSMKWAVKPRIVCNKNVNYALIQKVVDLVLHNSNVRESPIVRDTLLIDKQNYRVCH